MGVTYSFEDGENIRVQPSANGSSTSLIPSGKLWGTSLNVEFTSSSWRITLLMFDILDQST